MGTVAVTTETFQKEVLEADLPVVVDLWAAWCGPCRAVAPILEELSDQYAGKIKVTKVDVQANPQISAAFEVESIPTLAVLYKGALVGKVVGFGGRQHLEEVFKQVETVPEKWAEAEASGEIPKDGEA